jgi:hypothetical protein
MNSYYLRLLVAIFEAECWWISVAIDCEKSEADSIPPHPQSEGHSTQVSLDSAWSRWANS